MARPEGSKNKVQVTHCKRGHEFTVGNTYTHHGKRGCRVCRYECDRDRKVAMTKEQRSLMYRRDSLREMGWTLEHFNEVLEEQKGLCAVCKVVLTFEKTSGASSTRACADHVHTTPPKPRGILCAGCNVGIGMLKDNPEVIRASAFYIEKF